MKYSPQMPPTPMIAPTSINHAGKLLGGALGAIHHITSTAQMIIRYTATTRNRVGCNLMLRNRSKRNGSAKCKAISAADTYHHPDECPSWLDRFRKNGISSGRFPIHTSMYWENEVYDQN